MRINPESADAGEVLSPSVLFLPPFYSKTALEIPELSYRLAPPVCLPTAPGRMIPKKHIAVALTVLVRLIHGGRIGQSQREAAVSHSTRI